MSVALVGALFAAVLNAGAAADLDGDGLAEIAVVCSDGRLRIIGGTGDVPLQSERARGRPETRAGERPMPLDSYILALAALGELGHQ